MALMAQIADDPQKVDDARAIVINVNWLFVVTWGAIWAFILSVVGNPVTDSVKFLAT
jgi:hypothetical protein